MLKEEAMLIKETVNKEEFSTLTASNGQSGRFKPTYGLRETRISGKTDDIPKMTIQSWIERMSELTSGYELRKYWNMDELGFFFITLLGKSLVAKSRICKGRKKPKQCLTSAFFVAVNGSKILEPAVIWKSKSARCLKNIHGKTRPSMVHYFSNEKTQMRTEIMETILRLIDRKFQLERRKIILFLDNSRCHPETH